MNYSGIIFSDTANGIGVRTSLFVSGCRNHCEGCFNPETWDFDYGEEFDDKVKQKIFDNMDDNRRGITILGGDPLEPENIKVLLPFLKEFKSKFPNKTVWMYTGYLYENIDKDILEFVDVLIDGKFDIKKKSSLFPFRGSSNQRIIDVQKSLNTNNVVKIIK